MSNNQDGAVKPRVRIIDTSGSEYSVSHDRRNRRRSRPQGSQPKQASQASEVPPHIQQWPLETLVIQRAVLEYGRRASALGAQQGAQALKTLATKIKELGPPTPALEQILRDAENEASRLKMLLAQAYADDL